MNDELAELAGQVDALADQLNRFSADWQLVVAGGQDGCPVAEALRASTIGWKSQFVDAMLAGSFGSWSEALTHVAADALEAQEDERCAVQWMREDAQQLVVLISDEPEQSPSYAGTTWRDNLDRMRAVKRRSSQLVVSAVAGPVPEGCEGAEPGEGYVDIAAQSGGSFLSICEDWSDPAALGVLVGAGSISDTWVLTEPALVDTVSVWVDDIAHPSWVLDVDRNAVVLTSDLPHNGQELRIDYETTGACD
jgi:hypothetical protein